MNFLLKPHPPSYLTFVSLPPACSSTPLSSPSLCHLTSVFPITIPFSTPSGFHHICHPISITLPPLSPLHPFSRHTLSLLFPALHSVPPPLSPFSVALSVCPYHPRSPLSLRPPSTLPFHPHLLPPAILSILLSYRPLNHPSPANGS